MRPPCEVVVKKVLPAIRTVLVKDLIDRHELSQKEVADKLGLTQAAVSQYLSSARGDEKLEGDLQKSELFPKIQKLSDKIASGSVQRFQTIGEYCRVCNSMGKEGILCPLYAENISHLTEEECEAYLKLRDELS